MANAQLLRYGSKHLGQNFFFYFIVLDRFSCLPQDVYKHRMFTNAAKTANLSSQTGVYLVGVVVIIHLTRVNKLMW